MRMAISPGIQGKWYGQFGYEITQSDFSRNTHMSILIAITETIAVMSNMVELFIFLFRNQVTTPAAPIPKRKWRKNKNGLYVGNHILDIPDP